MHRCILHSYTKLTQTNIYKIYGSGVEFVDIILSATKSAQQQAMTDGY